MARLHADPYHNLFTQNTGQRLLKLLSSRYLRHKLALIAYENTHPDTPWLTQASIERLESYLQPGHLIFEWGSGKSTAWFANRVKYVTSIEHNPAWHAHVSTQLFARGLTNVDLRLVPEAVYSNQIQAFPDHTFDLVLVDALCRDLTFLESMPKVKPGGWIIFDNVNWYLPSTSRTPASRSLKDGPASSGFAEVLERVANWECVWTTNGVNDTAIFIKPDVTH